MKSSNILSFKNFKSSHETDLNSVLFLLYLVLSFHDLFWSTFQTVFFECRRPCYFLSFKTQKCLDSDVIVWKVKKWQKNTIFLKINHILIDYWCCPKSFKLKLIPLTWFWASKNVSSNAKLISGSFFILAFLTFGFFYIISFFVLGAIQIIREMTHILHFSDSLPMWQKGWSC